MATSPAVKHDPALIMSHSQTIENLRLDVERLTHWVDGNGEPGAKVRLAQLETSDKNMLEKLDGLKSSIDGLSKLARALVATSITIILPFAVWTFTIFIPSVLAHLGKAQP